MPWLLAGVLLAGLLLSGSAAWWQHKHNGRLVNDRLQTLGSDQADAAVEALARIEMGVRGLRGFVMGVGLDAMTRQDFRRYSLSREMPREFPGALGFGYIRRAAPDRLQDFVALAKANGWPDFKIRQLAPNLGEQRLIQFIEPIETNLQAIGLDIASESNRLKASQLALGRDTAVSTGPIRLVQSDGTASLGLLLLLAVNDAAARHPFDALGTNGPPALTYAAVQLDHLLRTAAGLHDQVRLGVTDITPGEKPSLAFDADKSDLAEGISAIQLTRTVYDRVWRFDVQARTALVTDLNLVSPTAVLAIGLLLTALAMSIALLWTRNRQNVRRALADHTRLNTLLENAADSALPMDLEGRVTLWNRAATETFGFDAQEAVGKTLPQLTLTPEHSAEDRQIFERAIRGERTPPFETQRRHRDGTVVDVEISAGPILDRNGAVVGVSKILRNIAERRLAANQLMRFNQELATQVTERTEQLRRTSADLRTVLDALPSLVGSWDRHLVNRFANQAYGDWFGKPPEDVVGRSVKDLLGEEGFQALLPRMEAALRGEVQTFEREITAPDGRTKQGLVYYLPDIDQGEVRGFYALIHDITAVKQAQLALADSEALLQRVGLIAQVGGWWVDIATGRVHWSQQTQTIHETEPGYVPTLEQAISFYDPQARPAVEQAVTAAMAGGPGWDLELPFITAKGRHIWVRAMGEVEFAGEGVDRHPVRIVGAFQDITLRHEAEQGIKEAKQAAEDANRAKGEFLTNMSHEIRTPLNSESGLGYMLEQHSMPPAQRAMVGQIQTAGRSLMGVVNDVLDLSKIEAGHMELDQAPFELEQYSRSAIEMLDSSAAAKGLALTLHVASEVPKLVVGDAAKITQILTNLVGNAIKFTASGSVHVNIELAADVQPDGVRMSVTDTGPGMTSELQARLFQPFSQGDTSITRKYGGTGLGLSIVSRLVKVMNGTVSLQSAPDQGSTFSIVLPLREASEEEVASADDHNAVLNVLVADDDALQREHLTRLGASMGWRTQCVDGGLPLVERVLDAERQGHRYDALIVDWQMPDLDGLQALAKLRERLGEVRAPAAVVVSAHDIARLRSAPHADLANSILVKPVNSSTMFNAVNTAVASNEAAHERMLQSTLVGTGTSVWLSGVRVLVADDSAINLDVARYLLEHEGAIVTCCNDGQQVLSLLQQAAQIFDAVLLDVQMPGMDGLEAAQRIRQQLGLVDLPLIALTAGVLSHERERAIASGMNDFLGKPLEPRRLIRTTRRLVERYRRTAVPVLSRDKPLGAESGPSLGIEGINEALVVTELRTARPLYLSMLQRFLSEFGDLDHAVPPQDEAKRDQLVARLHKLRGSALVVGAEGVAKWADRLEHSLKGKVSTNLLDHPLKRLAEAISSLKIHAATALEGARSEKRAGEDESAERQPTKLDQGALAEFEALLAKGSLSALQRFEALSPALKARISAEEHSSLRQALQELDFAMAKDIFSSFPKLAT